MSARENHLGAGPFVIAGISFFPLLGVPFGLIAVIWGLLTRKRGGRLLWILGICGIASTPVIYGTLYYKGFVETGGVYDGLRTKLSQRLLDQLVPAIETYRLQHGAYPETLKRLLDDGGAKPGFVFDPVLMRKPQDEQFFYYRVLDNGHYCLRGVGADGVAFTSDDLVPNVPNPLGQLGIQTDCRR